MPVPKVRFLVLIINYVIANLSVGNILPVTFFLKELLFQIVKEKQVIEDHSQEQVAPQQLSLDTLMMVERQE